MASLARGWPFAIIFAVATQCVLVGWGTWGDLMVDTGRELEWPRRLLAGETLYADLRFNYGPLGPHLNALLYRVFGVRLEVLAAAGVVTAVVASLTLFALARQFMGRVGSTAVAVTFLYVCGFSHYDRRGIFSWVLPHTFASTYGMLAALVSLYFLLRYARQARPHQMALSMGFLGVAALAKVEAVFPALVAHAVWFVGTQDGAGRRRAIQAAAPSAFGVAIVYGWFLHRTGPALWRDNLAGVVNPGSDYFIRYVMGFYDLRGNVTAMAVGAGMLGALAVAAWGTGVLARTGRAGAAARALVVCGVGVALLAYLAFVADTPDLLLRATPALVVAVGAWLLWRTFRSSEERGRWLPHLMLWSFAGASLPRIVLRATPENYGYFLLPPALIALGVFLVGYLPELAADHRLDRASVTAAGLALMLGTAALCYRVSLENVADKSVALSTPRGTMRLLPTEAAMFLPLIRRIEQTPPETRLLVLPESSSINFLTSRQGIDGMFSHLPMDYFGGYTEDAILARWERSPPDLILFHDALMPQFGDARYCVTYGRSTCRWMTRNFVPVTDVKEDAVLLAPRGTTRPRG